MQFIGTNNLVCGILDMRRQDIVLAWVQALPYLIEIYFMRSICVFKSQFNRIITLARTISVSILIDIHLLKYCRIHILLWAWGSEIRTFFQYFENIKGLVKVFYFNYTNTVVVVVTLIYACNILLDLFSRLFMWYLLVTASWPEPKKNVDDVDQNFFTHNFLWSSFNTIFSYKFLQV